MTSKPARRVAADAVLLPVIWLALLVSDTFIRIMYGKKPEHFITWKSMWNTVLHDDWTRTP